MVIGALGTTHHPHTTTPSTHPPARNTYIPWIDTLRRAIVVLRGRVCASTVIPFLVLRPHSCHLIQVIGRQPLLFFFALSMPFTSIFDFPHLRQ